MHKNDSRKSLSKTSNPRQQVTLGRASNKQSEEETHAMSQKVIESISADILSKIQKRQQKLEQNEIVDEETPEEASPPDEDVEVEP